MRRYWLLDQHGGDGPTALVETDGGLHVIDILRFGPDVTDLAAQQVLWDRVIGTVAPTLKPLVDAAELDEEGVAPHAKLRRRGKPNLRSRASSGGSAPGRRGHPASGGRHGPNRRSGHR